ncbi:MAG: hypothetical protein QNJ94_07115 [Alphaproteobacteria bacterium]|nr:hypothetical protein [Alphaproteobacteria bacterium]
MTVRHLVLGAAAVGLVACAGAPEVDYNTYDAVVISYHTWSGERAQADAKAAEACSAYGRTPRFVTITEDPVYGDSATFMCHSKLPL